MTNCEQVGEDLADLVADDPEAIARHADHLASCDDCRDTRHEATQLALRVGLAGADHVAPANLADRMLALLDARAGAPTVEQPAAFGPDATQPGFAVPPAALKPGVSHAEAFAALAGAAPAAQPDEITTTREVARHDGTGASTRQAARPDGTAASPSEIARTDGAGASNREAARSDGTGASTRQAARPDGTAASPSEIARTDGAGASNREAARSDHAGASNREAARSDDAGASNREAARSDHAGASNREAARADGAGASIREAARIEVAPGRSDAAVTGAEAAPRNRESAKRAQPTTPLRGRRKLWLVGGAVALAAGGAIYVASSGSEPGTTTAPVADVPAAKLLKIERAAKDAGDGVAVRDHGSWRALHKDEAIPAGAELRTDERTRASIQLADGTKFVLDHRTELAFAPGDARQIKLTAGRLAADVVHVDGHPAAIVTPNGKIDVVGTRFTVTATDALTAVQVSRGSVVLSNPRGEHDEVHAGEEGTIERGALTVAAVPAVSREAAWSELGAPAKPDEVTSGLGALRAYKPGESRDRDWNLALAKHDVKVRIVGPIARTEITETFRNDTTTTLEGVYQFPLPPDAQIDGLALDEPGKAGSFIAGAFVDKERGAKIWRGVIDKATPKMVARPQQEMIWVEGRWRDPALLDWKRGGRFELHVYPIPAKGARTIKIAYTQVVTPRGPWRQYIYPLPHSQDGSTVADQMTVDVEVRGAAPGLTRAVGYDMAADPNRKDTSALTLTQSGFVPRGDLVVEYRATDGDAELRAWSYAGGAAVAPDEKLAKKKNVGLDPKVLDAQRAVAADMRPTAVVALHPKLPRWTEARPRDYAIVIDASQSMVGERFARSSELAAAVVDQMDRRDRFTVLACDSECRKLGDLRTPSPKASAEVKTWLAAQAPAGSSDLVGSVRAATDGFGSTADRDQWVLYVGDGFASTGFRRVADVERAIHLSQNARVTTIGLGTDADAAVLQAVARGGGGSYLAWTPGEHAAAAAAQALESTYGNALRDAVVELPAGMVDVAPTVLPTIRAGEEVLIGARISGDVAGDVVVRGSVAGQPFEQHYPVKLAVSTAAGNAFVPRLWASLAIDQLERNGEHDDRAKIVGMSQGYGVMSRETSLLVLESQAMFDAFGVDRGQPQTTWTGEEQLEEVAGTGTVAMDPAPPADAGKAGLDATATTAPPPPPPSPASKPSAVAKYDEKTVKAEKRNKGADKAYDDEDKPKNKKMPTAHKPPANAERARMESLVRSGAASSKDLGGEWIELKRIWIRTPSVTPYDAVGTGIQKAIASAETALAEKPDSRERHRALVQALSYAGELDRARDVAKKWLDRDQLDPQALGYLADLYGRAGDRELGLRTLAGLVDLDADKVALHDRMVKAYEQVGRLSQACAHRVAIASIQPKITATSAAALRCLRGLGRDKDAELIVRALPDDATRATVEKAALTVPSPAPVAGDLVIKAHWDNGADLDLTLLTPEGSRVSWMGGRTDVLTSDVTSSDHEALAVKYLRRGNYLVEISRASTSGKPIHGTLEITALGAKRSIPFELTTDRRTIGRVSVSLRETFEDLDGNPVILYDGADRKIIRDVEVR